MQKRQVKEFMNVRLEHHSPSTTFPIPTLQPFQTPPRKIKNTTRLTKPQGLWRSGRALLRVLRRRLHLQGHLDARERLHQPLRHQVDGHPAARQRALPGAQRPALGPAREPAIGGTGEGTRATAAATTVQRTYKRSWPDIEARDEKLGILIEILCDIEDDVMNEKENPFSSTHGDFGVVVKGVYE